MMSLFLMLFFFFQTIFRTGCVCENRFERWSSLIFWFVAVVKMPHILWFNGRNMSADFICFSTLTDAVRILFLFEISKCSSSVLWERVLALRVEMCIMLKFFFVLFCFCFFFFFGFYFCCRCGLFAWYSSRHWLTTRLCSSKDKRFAYFSLHVIFKNAHFTTCYSCTHSHRTHFFRLFGCYCCLSLTHFNILRNAFTIVIRHTRKVALQTTKEKERRWARERERETQCRSESVVPKTTRPKLFESCCFTATNRIENSNRYVLVFCLVYTTSKYTTTLLLLLLKSISFHCCYVFFSSSSSSAILSFIFFFARFLHYYYSRCYRAFLLAYTHPSWNKWRDDFSFGLFFSSSFLSFSFSLAPKVSTVAHQHHCSQLTIFHSLHTTFFAQVFCIYSRLNIEHLSAHHFWALNETHVWKIQFTFFFRFVDFLTFISILSSNEHSTVIEQPF